MIRWATQRSLASGWRGIRLLIEFNGAQDMTVLSFQSGYFNKALRLSLRNTTQAVWKDALSLRHSSIDQTIIKSISISQFNSEIPVILREELAAA